MSIVVLVHSNKFFNFLEHEVISIEKFLQILEAFSEYMNFNLVVTWNQINTFPLQHLN